jgi:hypothetical protein
MGDNPTYNSISTNQISTATITASTIYARTSVSTTNVYANYLRGDGSALSNLSRTSYGAFSIPWNAMEDEGSINLRSATWIINGLVAATNMSVSQILQASTIVSQSFSTTNGRIANLVSPVICSFYISTNTIKTTNVYFDHQFGKSMIVDSTITKSISTDILTTNTLDIVKFIALQGTFSTISTGFWEVETIKSDRLQLLDLSSLIYGYVTLSANILYLNNSSILSNVIEVDELVSTTKRLQLDLIVASNYLYAHDSLSSLNSTTTKQWSISQVAFSTLSTGIADLSLNTTTAASNLSVAVTTKIIDLSNYTNTMDSNISTTITNRLSNYQIAVASQFITLSNYLDNADTLLKQGLSSTACNISFNTSNQISNTSTSIGGAVQNLTTGLSSVAFMTTTGISTIYSTLSTQAGWNFSTSFGSLSSSISNLSTFYTPTFAELRQGNSTNASNISVMWGSVFSSLSTTGLFESVSSFSTAIGTHVAVMSNSLVGGTNSVVTYVNNNVNFLSTVAGSNFSTLRVSVSSLSTVIHFNLSTVSTNLNILSNISLSAFSTLSTTIGQTSNYLTYFSTVSTLIGSTNSTLYSHLARGISSLATAMAANDSVLYYNLSTQAIFTSSISSANLTSKVIFTSTFVTSTLSTGLGFFNSFQGSTMSTLTQQIGRLFTTQITASSFSGNLNDATTVVIQTI